MARRLLIAVAMPLTAIFLASCGERPSYRLAWRLPEGLSLEYLLETGSEMESPEDMTGAVSVSITVIAPRTGTALLDAKALSISMQKDGQEQPLAASMNQSFRARTLLTENAGFDPYHALQQEQRNLFDMMFPLPDKEVKVGERWPAPIRLMTLGSGVSGHQESVARFRSVRTEEGDQVAHIGLDANVSGEGARGQVRGGMNLQVSGEAVFNLTKGCMKQNEMWANASLSAADVAMTMKNHLSLRLVKVAELSDAERRYYGEMLTVREAIHRSVQLAQTGQYDKALETVEPVLDSSFREEHARVIAAQLYAALKKPDKAEQAIEAELARFPEDLQVLGSAAELYQYLGKLEKADEIDQKIQKLSEPE